MSETIKSTAEARPDLIHPFQWQPGREEECSHFYLWLGGFVKCGAKESDSIHRNGPHEIVASDGERAYCAGNSAQCEACWQESRLKEMGSVYALQQERSSRRRMNPKERFADDLADMVKAVERSRR